MLTGPCIKSSNNIFVNFRNNTTFKTLGIARMFKNRIEFLIAKLYITKYRLLMLPASQTPYCLAVLFYSKPNFDFCLFIIRTLRIRLFGRFGIDGIMQLLIWSTFILQIV